MQLLYCVRTTTPRPVGSVNLGPALAEAHAAGMGIIIKEALANGRLTERNTSPMFANKLELLRQTAESVRQHACI